MPAVFLPSYSASFVPVNSGAFPAYWSEIQDKIAIVLRSFGWRDLQEKLPVVAGSRICSYTGLTRKDDICAIGTYFRNRKLAGSASSWAAQYDIAGCSFDTDFVEQLRECVEQPMKNVRIAGHSETLFPVLVGTELLIAYDQGVSGELERELMINVPGLATA